MMKEGHSKSKDSSHDLTTGSHQCYVWIQNKQPQTYYDLRLKFPTNGMFS